MTASITLQNFQGIRRRTTVPLAPLTLVYGPNSAGKSTLADAISFITKIFDSKTSTSELRILENRWASHLPAFVSPKDRAHDMVICVTVPSPRFDDFLSSWNSSYSTKYGQMAAYLGLHCPYLIVEVTFSRHGLVSYSLATQDGPLFRIATSERHASTAELNTSHPGYCEVIKDWGDIDDFENALKHAADLLETERRGDWLTVCDADTLSPTLGQSPLAFEQQNLTDLAAQEEFETFLNGFVSGIGVVVRQYFGHRSVPPIRPIPKFGEARFEVPASVTPGILFPDRAVTSAYPDWNRLAAIICIAKTAQLQSKSAPATTSDVDEATEPAGTTTVTEDLWSYANRIISNPSFLNLGYTINGSVTYSLKEFDLARVQTSRVELGELLSHSAKTVHLFLRDSADHTVALEDVGAGVSQVIPVVLASYCDKYVDHRLTYIQQPELHLHPKLQAQLADVFIERLNAADRDRIPQRFIIESHSEHLMLRILRRIRETNAGHISNRLFGLRNSHVAVLYADKSDGGETSIKQLRVAPDGEFMDRWPKGFFTEREEELLIEDE